MLKNSIEKLKANLNSLNLDEQSLDLIDTYIDDFNKELQSNFTKRTPLLDEHFKKFSYFPGIVLVFDDNYKVVYQNKSILGKAKIIGQNLSSIIAFVNEKTLFEDAQKVLNFGEARKTSFINPFNQKPIDIYLNKYFFNNNKYLLAFIEDINIPRNPTQIEKDKDKNEKQRAALLNKYKLITNSISDVFFLLDKKLRFSFVATSVERVLKYKYEELIGKSFDILIPECCENTLSKNLDTLMLLKANIAEPQTFTLQLCSKYEELNWYEVQITGVYNDTKNLVSYYGICRDITERMKYEEALRLAKKKAEESDKLKSAFLANMSHEIRTPLNGIIGFSTMLTNRYMPDDKKERYADYIISSSKQLLALISDIIDISKIEAGQLSIFKAEFDVIQLLRELEETIGFEKVRLSKDDVNITLTLPKEENIFFCSDEVRIRQVLINLLSNALKFTNKGIIDFGCELLEPNRIRFYVKDSGVGIPKELHKVVFERFRQGEVDVKAKIVGTGLGLAISKGLIELMGGEIGLYSQESKGTEFFFTLPNK